MENFLFVSADAALVPDLARQVHREGHDVKYHIAVERDRETGDGFVPTVDDWRAEVEWADVVVFDGIWAGSDIGTGKTARDLRQQGRTVVGGMPNTDRLADIVMPNTRYRDDIGKRWVDGDGDRSQAWGYLSPAE